MSGATAAKAPTAFVLAEQPARLSTLRDYLELTKPRLTSLVSLTALVGFHAGTAGRVELGVLVSAVLGTTLLAGSACVLNQVMETEQDALMERTRTRPLPSGRLGRHEATVFGAALTVTGMLLLIAGTNALTSFLGLVAVVSYLGVYTPLKRKTGLCTLFGALPGALPPAMGWTAAAGELGPGAWTLFGILFLWQLPHFLAIGWMRRDDYARSGFSMISVVDPHGTSTSRQVVLQCLALLPVSLMPAVLGLAGLWYFGAAFLLGLAYLGYSIRLALARTTEAARSLFYFSLVYLPALLTVLMLDKVPR